jgi:hypothetical protein
MSRSAKAISTLARRMNAVVSEKAPLLAIAIHYETGQTNPALYLSYETLDHCMERLRDLAKPEAVKAYVDRVERQRANDIEDKFQHNWAQGEAVSAVVGPLFDTGYWMAPADDFLGDDPDVQKWAADLFGTKLTDEQREKRTEEEYTAQLEHLRSTLWAVHDEARRTNTGGWPPFSFVVSFDDEAQYLLHHLVSRSGALAPWVKR